MQKHWDLTEGSIYKNILVFSLPLLIGSLLQNLYNVINSIWLGRFVGPEALAAVSASFFIVFIIVSMIMGFSMAVSILVAQYVGARRFKDIKELMDTANILALVSAVSLTLFGILISEWLLHLVQTPPEVFPLAKNYLNIFFLGFFFIFSYNLVVGLLRVYGDTRTPLYFLVYSLILNALLDPLFIIVLDWGVSGAALATLISQALSFFLGANYLKKKYKPLSIWSYKYNRDITKTIVKLGLPFSIQQFAVSTGMLVVSSLVNSLGTIIMAAFGAGSRIDALIMTPFHAISMATSTVTGQHIGAQKYDRIKAIVRASSLIVILIALTMASLIYGFAPYLIGIFVTEPEVISEGVRYLRIISFSYFPLGWTFALSGIMRGAGVVLPPTIISIITLWLIRVPGAYYLNKTLALGAGGIWWAIVASATLSILLTWGYLWLVPLEKTKPIDLVATRK